MKVKMLVSTTRINKGKVVNLDDKEAKRLIDAGYAELHEESGFDDDYLANLGERMSTLEKEFAELKTRLGETENALADLKENAAKPPTKPGKKDGK